MWDSMWASTDVYTNTHRDRKDKGLSGVFYAGNMKPQPSFAVPGVGMIWVHGAGSCAAFDGHSLDHGSLPTDSEDCVKIMGACYVCWVNCYQTVSLVHPTRWLQTQFTATGLQKGVTVLHSWSGLAWNTLHSCLFHSRWWNWMEDDANFFIALYP
jgi:hypothetical protein